MRKVSLIGHYKLDATPKMSHWSILNIEGLFGRVDFGEDEKKKKREKMRRENFLEGVWLEEGEKNVSWSQVCSPKSSLQNGEKTEWGEFDR